MLDNSSVGGIKMEHFMETSVTACDGCASQHVLLQIAAACPQLFHVRLKKIVHRN